MTATYTKLKDGTWGVRVNGTITAGATATVTKKSGETKTEKIGRVLWTGNGVSLCSVAASSVKSTYTPQSGRSSRGRRTGCSCGSIEGEYRDYCCSSCRFDELDQ